LLKELANRARLHKFQTNTENHNGSDHISGAKLQASHMKRSNKRHKIIQNVPELKERTPNETCRGHQRQRN